MFGTSIPTSRSQLPYTSKVKERENDTQMNYVHDNSIKCWLLVELEIENDGSQDKSIEIQNQFKWNENIFLTCIEWTLGNMTATTC